MKKNPLFLDLETFSEVDIMSAGAHKYAEDCRIDLCSWAIGPNMPVEMWDATCEPMPKILKQELENPERIKVAHNSNFDRNVLNHQLIRTEVEEWEDTMVIAYTLALPGRLDHMLLSLGADNDYQKIADGKRLVRMFCKPQKVTKNQPHVIRNRHTDPIDWAKYIEYGIQDTETMRWAYYKMPQWVIGRNGKPSAKNELDLWHLSERINDRGLPIDIKLAEEAIKLTDIALARLNKELHKLTGGAADAHSKRDAVLKWIASQGVSMNGYTKEDLTDALKLELPDNVRRVLEIRQEAGRTSTAKYQSLINGVSIDGRLRGGIQYYGAKRTGRYAGRKFQPHNLPHPEVKDTDSAAEAIINNTTDLLYEESAMALAVSCVRSAIKAPTGKILGVTDLSNIEGRVLPWLAGEAWKLKAFEDYDNGTGPDLYKLAYNKSFGVPVEQITKDQRQIGKFQELSLGYQGGVGAFYKQAKKFGTDMDALYKQVEDKITDTMMDSAQWMLKWVRENRHDLDEVSDNGIIGADVIKQMWRNAHPKVCDYWYTLESMVRFAIDNEGGAFSAGLIKASVRDDKLLILLPSKRPLIYNYPKINKNGDIFYMNHDKGAWRSVGLYGGKIAENCIAEGTEVLTNHGWIKIENFKKGMQVWDGVKWVYTGKLVNQGVQTVVECFGVSMTPDHLVLTTEGWKNASQSERYNRAACGIPNSSKVFKKQWYKVFVESSLRLWKDHRVSRNRISKTKEERCNSIVWLYESHNSREKEYYPRYVNTPCLCSMAFNGRQMQVANTSSMAQLRCTWGNSMQTMEKIFSEFLVRHGKYLQSWTNIRQKKEQWKLHTKKLPMGRSSCTSKQQKNKQVHKNTKGENDYLTGCQVVQNKDDNVKIPHISQMADEKVVYKTRRNQSRVYDIINCGNLTRFTVRNPKGEPMIVHNCVQAVARDVLTYNMPAIDKVYPIIGTVHDETISEVGELGNYDEVQKELNDMLSVSPPWATGLPLNADGYISQRYKKD